jgi:hypothetical protein
MNLRQKVGQRFPLPDFLQPCPVLEKSHAGLAVEVRWIDHTCRTFQKQGSTDCLRYPALRAHDVLKVQVNHPMPAKKVRVLALEPVTDGRI